MTSLEILGLMVLTALAESGSCYLVGLWKCHKKSAWLLIPAVFSFVSFAWLLMLHPAAPVNRYAGYGVVYMTVAYVWLLWIKGSRPNFWICLGVVLCLTGSTTIIFGGR